MRWSFKPAASPVSVPPDELKKRDPDFFAKEITERVAQSPQRWTMTVAVANPGDPTVLPAGMRTSDDPFPAARSAAYSVSYNRRTAEKKDYPRATREASRDGRSTAIHPAAARVALVMALCILTMLYVGVGMVSTIKPEYLTLVSVPFGSLC